MGQALSGEWERQPDQQPEGQVVLPLSLPRHKTTILDLGEAADEKGCVWHVVGGHKVFPFPCGFRATCEVYGMPCSLAVERLDGRVVFTVRTGAGVEYSGSSPTAPFAKMALTLRRLDVVNGMEAFGFTSKHVRSVLRTAWQANGELDQPLAIMQDSGNFSRLAPAPALASAPISQPLQWLLNGNAAAGRSSGAGGSGDAAAHRAAAVHGQHIGGAVRMPSAAPSLQNWLVDAIPGLPQQVHGGSARSGEQKEELATAGTARTAGLPPSLEPISPHPNGLEIPIMVANENHMMSMPAFGVGECLGGLCWVRERLGGLLQGGNANWPSPAVPALPQLAKGSRPPSRAAVDRDEAAALLAARPPSRARARRPASANGTRGSGGRGWTAFTAYGLEMRDVVRAEAPWASATEVEKLVGQRWAALSQQEKQKYVDLAARVRQMGGAGAGGAPAASGPRAARSEGDPMEGSAFGGAGGGAPGLKRTRSDAATGLTLAEDRPQRHVRPNRQYSTDLYETPYNWLAGGDDEDGEEGAGKGDAPWDEEMWGAAPAEASKRGGGQHHHGSSRAAHKSRQSSPPSYEDSVLARLMAQTKQWQGPGSHPPASAAAVDSQTAEEDVLGLLAAMREKAIASDSEADNSPPRGMQAHSQEGRGDSTGLKGSGREVGMITGQGQGQRELSGDSGDSASGAGHGAKWGQGQAVGQPAQAAM